MTFNQPNITLNSWNGANTKCLSGGHQTVCIFDNQVVLKNNRVYGKNHLDLR